MIKYERKNYATFWVDKDYDDEVFIASTNIYAGPIIGTKYYMSIWARNGNPIILRYYDTETNSIKNVKLNQIVMMTYFTGNNLVYEDADDVYVLGENKNKLPIVIRKDHMFHIFADGDDIIVEALKVCGCY